MKSISVNTFKKFSLILLSASVLTVSTSCGTAGDILKLIFEQPKVSIKSFGVTDASLDRIKFNLALNVDNPNAVGLKTSDIDYNLNINNSEIIKGILNNGIDIAAKNTSSLDVPIEINFQKLLTVAPSILTNFNNLDYKVFGAVKFDTPIGKVPINWNQEGKLDFSTISKLFGP